jgi:hypothetical protein
MKIDGASALSTVQRTQIASPKPPESEQVVTDTDDGGQKAKGVISKLNEGDHFKGVASVRLLISHFDNADLQKINPDDLPDPQNVPGNAYAKFLDQYRSMYNASQVTIEPEEPPVTEEPAAEIPAPDTAPGVSEEPVIEIPSGSAEQPTEDVPVVPEEPPVTEVPVNEIPVTDTVFVPPIEINPVTTPEQTEPASPISAGEETLAVFKALWDAQALEQTPGIVNMAV